MAYKPLETMYLSFLKKKKEILRRRNQTHNLAVYGEFGSLPKKEQNNIKTLKYYRRLVPVFKHMHALGHATWFLNVQVVILIIELNDQDNIDLLQLKNSHIYVLLSGRSLKKIGKKTLKMCK